MLAYFKDLVDLSRTWRWMWGIHRFWILIFYKKITKDKDWQNGSSHTTNQCANLSLKKLYFCLFHVVFCFCSELNVDALLLERKAPFYLIIISTIITIHDRAWKNWIWKNGQSSLYRATLVRFFDRTGYVSYTWSVWVPFGIIILLFVFFFPDIQIIFSSKYIKNQCLIVRRLWIYLQ